MKRCDEIGDNYFMRFEWFVDEAMPLLCGDALTLIKPSRMLKILKKKFLLNEINQTL